MFTLEMTNIGMARMFALVNSLVDQQSIVYSLADQHRHGTGHFGQVCECGVNVHTAQSALLSSYERLFTVIIELLPVIIEL